MLKSEFLQWVTVQAMGMYFLFPCTNKAEKCFRHHAKAVKPSETEVVQTNGRPTKY